MIFTVRDLLFRCTRHAKAGPSTPRGRDADPVGM